MIPNRFTYPSPGFDFYWKQGRGRKMLRKLDKIPGKELIEQHIPLLFEFDQLADEVVRETYLKLGYQKTDALLNTIFEAGIEAAPEAPESLKQLFREVNTVPEWLDWTKLEQGSAFCRRSSSLGLVVLRNYCLMGGYESAAINKPLIFTGALKKGDAKRIAETTEFWVAITHKNALNQNAAGFKYAVKVRLMHAYARVSVRKMPEWENESWGEPINLWDMIATNLGFSLVFMEGLKNLGLKPNQQEIEGLFHLWKYVGYLLGIPAHYLPDTEKQAIAELYKWTITQPPADEDTQALAQALMNEPYNVSFPKYLWQKRLVLNVHLAYNYFFLGKRSCNEMGLPKSSLGFLPRLVPVFRFIPEMITQRSKRYYDKRVENGRKKQEHIKDLFLEGHSAALAHHPHRAK
ncbi:MAG: hypothetical protein A3D31_05725 [Candidatus Fluviicola riflensis]|nr:MAG: hypothetical protein CHH17_09290 [Candidatus Fluviicola riflensis]OGS79468.1 MAG: hypothetical protein A3D31_05725 [Candidatus Fluviicola riflensis]OGS86899.1 MAG: hypothetical protein A2724_05185 [Fluviicola sp. RIFCSPHIGHO2_01_FULL_43_53]OGS89690.1 MAG: hypothetical protein A3E30_01930 [Fluviicola sp. RIFCSPHIGHO2_12_FULL_43_24]